MLRRIQQLVPVDGLFAAYRDAQGKPYTDRIACLALVEEFVGNGRILTRAVGLIAGEKLTYADALPEFAGYCWSKSEADSMVQEQRIGLDLAKLKTDFRPIDPGDFEPRGFLEEDSEGSPADKPTG